MLGKECCARPITSSWAIAEARQLGPEFLTWLLCDAGVGRRQVVFALAAHGWLGQPEGVVAQLAPDHLGDAPFALCDLLRASDLNDLVCAGFGYCPEGYLGGLRRIGPDAFSDPESYRQYFSLFSEPHLKPRRRVAQHLGTMTEAKLRMLLEIDGSLLHVAFIDRLSSIEEVHSINTALAAVRAASDREQEAALVAAAVDGAEDQRVERFVSAWIKRCRFPNLPFDTDAAAGVFPLQDAAELIARSIRYRNCARGLHRVVDAIAGRSAYVAYEPEGKPTAMALLYRLSNGAWLVEGIYGPGNARVPAPTQTPLRAWFADRGVLSLDRPRLAPEWKTILGIVGHGRWAELEPEHELIEA